MSAKANRCPHCWAALSEHVTDFCPFCRGSVAVKQKRRRGDETPERRVERKVATPPPAPPPLPHEPYQPYEDRRPAPAHPMPAPVDYFAAAAPAAGGVAVAERDPVEFPGTPLPPGFFDALPEKVRNTKPRRIPLRVIGVGAAIALGSLGGIGGIRQAADRDHALSSPARHLVESACAEYRDFTTRLRKDPQDVAATEQAVRWFQGNVDRFAEAAMLDPELSAASGVVTWFDSAIEANFAPLEAMSDAEIDAREEPLAQACYNGPGRA